MRVDMSVTDNYTEQVVSELQALRKVLDEFPRDQVVRVVTMARTISDALIDGKVVFTCGNGGSAADAQHIAGELVGRFRRKKKKGYRSFALTVNSSVVTALANDYSYDDVFSRQLESVGSEGDVLLALSTSGNSPNVINAAETASGMGIKTLALTGGDGGRLASIADISMNVPHDDFARIQEVHITIGHILCGLVEDMVSAG